MEYPINNSNNGTPEKAAEETNNNNTIEQNLLDALLAYIPDAIYFKDRQSRFIRASQSMACLFGFNETNELIGKTDFDFFTNEHASQAFADEQEIMRTGKPLVNIIEKETFKHDKIRWVSTTKLPLTDNNGNIIGVFGVSRNITEMVELENQLSYRNEELQAAEEELRQNIEELKTIQEELYRQKEKLAEQNKVIHQQNTKLEQYTNSLEFLVSERTKDLEFAKLKAEESERLKTAFLANLSHEIRTPMNSIVGFAHLVASEKIENEKVRKYINFIHTNADSLMLLINDIIDMSLIEINQLPVNIKPFVLNDLINETFKITAKVIKNSNLSVKLNHTLQKSNLTVISDKERIFQVIKNLLNNAEKYTNQGYIELGTYIENDRLCIYVEDTGIGVPEPDLLFIFDRFRKGDNEKNKLYRGAGLGLTISKKIITMLGGDINVKSECDKGSVFTICLPMSVVVS